MDDYPRLKDLPRKEQAPFDKWLIGQTCPICDPDLPKCEWDWYYPWDYDRWKKGLPII